MRWGSRRFSIIYNSSLVNNFRSDFVIYVRDGKLNDVISTPNSENNRRMQNTSDFIEGVPQNSRKLFHSPATKYPQAMVFHSGTLYKS